MKLSREKIQRMIGQREAGGSGGSSFDPSTLAGFATQSWVEQAYIAKAFWNELFIIHKKETTTITEPGEDPVVTVHTDLDDPTVLPFAPNELPSTTVTTDEETGIEVTVATSIDSIEAKVGFWTDFYLSALGQGSGGGGGGASTLANLLDVELTTPIDNGQALVYDSQLGKWVNGAGGGGATALGNLTDVQLTTPIDDGQALVYNTTLGKWVNGASTLANLTDVQLTTPLSDGQGLVYDGTLGKWVNGDGFLTQTAADLRYLKLAGGTMTNTDLVTNLNADLLDGTHKAELFSSLTTSGNDLSITIGGTTKTLAVPYATKAGQLNIARSLWGNSFDGTADITGTLTIDNSNWLRFKNQSGTARRVMSLFNDSGTDKLIIGFDTCTDGLDTYLDGQNINFRYFANGASSASLGMILNSSGNFGIGTASPSYKLHVNGYAFATRFYLASGVYLEYDSANSGVHLVGAGFYSDSYVSALGQGSGGGGGGGASALYECTDVRKDPNADKVADASTGKVLTYGNDGKWYAKAVTVTDISGNAGTATKLLTARSLWGNSFDGTADITGTLTIDNSSWLRFKNQSGTARRVMSLFNDSNTDKLIIGFDTCTDGIDTYLDGENVRLRYHASGDAAASLGMILNSSGNVGIGTSSPSYKLHVNGYAFATRFYLASGVYLEYDSANSGVHLVGAGFYSDSYVTALGQGSGGGGGGGALADLVDVALSNPQTGEVLMYNGTTHKWYNGTVQSGGSGTVTSITAGTGLSGGTITVSGTIAIDSTYQGYISHGETAYGWGNHANAGYLTQTAADGRYLKLSGGTMTGQIEMATGNYWYDARNYAIIRNTKSGASDGSYRSVFSSNTKNGDWSMGTMGADDKLYAVYSTGSSSGYVKLTFPTTAGTLALTSDISSAVADYLPLTGGTMANTTVVTNLNADLLDGTHKANLFSSLTTSNNDISITIGGTNKTLTVPYATKAAQLNTARTLWGQSFDGSANISGDMTDVGDVTINYNKWIKYKDSSDVARNVMCFYFDSTSNNQYLFVGNGTRRAGYDSYFEGNNIYMRINTGVSGTTAMYLKSDGCVGIGTTSPTHPLHVVGNMCVTANQNAAYIQIGLIKIIYDGTNNALKIEKSDGTAANIYATGSVVSLA